MGRTSSLYLDRRSPPLPPPPPPPLRVASPPLYTLVPPTETGFLTGGSAIKAGENFGTGSTRSLLDGSEFQYRGRLLDPYVERSRERENDRLYAGRGLHLERDGEMDRLYPSKGVLGADLAPSAYAGSSSSLLAKERPYRVHDGPGYEPTNGYAMEGIGRLSHDTLGHVSGHAHRFSESPLEHGSGRDDTILSRQKHSNHSPRDADRDRRAAGRPRGRGDDGRRSPPPPPYRGDDRGRYDGPPDYMLPDHRSSLRPARKDGEFFGGRSGNKDSEFFGEPGMTLRVCSTEMGRTSSLYLDRRSPPLPPPPPPPLRVASPPLYTLVPPTETGFLTGGSAIKAGKNFGTGSTRSLLDGSEFQYRGRLLDPYVERKRPYRVHDGPGYEPTNGYAMEGIGRLSHDTLGHVSGHAHRFSESPLEHGSGRDDKILSRQKHSNHSPRDASMEYGRRDPVSAYLPPENLHGNGPQVSSPSVRRMLGSSSLTDHKDERIDHQVRLPHRMAEDEDTFQGMHDGMECDVQHSYRGDELTYHRRTRNSDVRYSRSPETERLKLGRHPAQHGYSSFNDSHELSDQEVSPVVSRGRAQKAMYRDHVTEQYQAHSPLGRDYYDDDVDSYDLSPQRMAEPYDMVDDQDKYDARYDLPNNRNVFSRITLRDDTNDGWTDADQENNRQSNSITYGYSKNKPISQRLSRPTGHSQFGGFPMHGRGRGGWSKSAKKRLRSALPQFHAGSAPGGDGFARPNKRFKLSEVNHDDPQMSHEDAPEDEDISMQKDPPEGSEEFTKQVHQAFLKYTKLLNESPTMQNRYREAAKGSLSCCVCGSVPRKFLDIDALISHAYNTCKMGLKTKHLGFHKALCVLMGWNWHIAPDTTKAYHSMPDEEVNAMKGDLMLWPPVVIIHNSSIATKAKATDEKIVSKEEIDGVLTEIGVACDKAKISHGRPANQSVFLVKFLPTISGFQEAMRIHEHFTAKNHGKEEFQQIKGGKGKKAAPVDELEELLYAHIAVAEDLGYLDEESKKRCLVRSKNDIEAKADATLNLDS
uniref:XS domain-containing protein n=1 Tax=Oryza punctata TaxID=4537 RepID=A0A0E0MK75_ORYPU